VTIQVQAEARGRSPSPLRCQNKLTKLEYEFSSPPYVDDVTVASSPSPAAARLLSALDADAIFPVVVVDVAVLLAGDDSSSGRETMRAAGRDCLLHDDAEIKREGFHRQQLEDEKVQFVSRDLPHLS